MPKSAKQGKRAHGLKYGGGSRGILKGKRTRRRRAGGLSLRQRAKTKRWQARRQAKAAARRRAGRGGRIR